MPGVVVFIPAPELLEFGMVVVPVEEELLSPAAWAVENSF